MEKFDLSLLDNAYSFQTEALRAYNRASREKAVWPFAIVSIVQAIELLVKAALEQEHPLFIFEDIDHPRHTLSLAKSLDRLKAVGKTPVDEGEEKRLRKAIQYRNEILHYKFQFTAAHFRALFIELYEFTYFFHFRHFGKELHLITPKNLAKQEAHILANFKSLGIPYDGLGEVKNDIPLTIIRFQKYQNVRGIDGKIYHRIPYGSETRVWHTSDESNCPDCGVRIGQYHIDACDIEECPICHEQFMGCPEIDEYIK